MIKLSEEFNVPSPFNVGDLMPYLEGDKDLQPNPTLLLYEIHLLSSFNSRHLTYSKSSSCRRPMHEYACNGGTR